MKVKRAKDLGTQFVNNPHKMVGQDGAFSIPLNGDTLWFFGDTLIGDRVPGESLWYPGGEWVGHRDMSGIGPFEKMINNTGLIVPGQTGSDGIKNFKYICDDKNNLRPLIPLLENEDPDWIRIWCLHGITLDEKVYLYFIKIKMLEHGPLPANFEIIGSGLAVGSKSDWNFRRISHNDTDILWPLGQPHFAAAVLPEQKDGWLYLYGTMRGEDEIQKSYLSRVKPNEIEILDAYQYLSTSKADWSLDIKDATPVFDGMPNEMSVSFNNYFGCFLAVHSLDLTGKIVARTAENPWGPWSEPSVIWDVKVENEKPIPYPRLIYAGKEHPSLSDRNGKIIYITYIEFEEYYPHLVEVEFA